MNRKGQMKTGAALTIVVILLAVVAFAILYTVFKPTAQVITPGGGIITPGDCIANAQAAGKYGEASTIYASAIDGAATNTETQRATTAYFWNKDDLSSLIPSSAGTTLSASATTVISGFNRGDILGGVAFDSTYFGIPITETCVDSDSVNVKFRVYRATDAIKMWFKGNDSIDTTILDFAGTQTTELVKELHIQQNQSADAYNFAGIYFDFITNSNVTTVGVGGSEMLFADTAQRTKAGLTSPGSLTFSKVAGSPFGSNTRRAISDVVFTTEPLILLEGDEIVVKNLQFTLDADKCGTAEAITVYTFDKGYFVSSAGVGVSYGYETDAATPADAGVADTGGSFKTTINCQAS